jgi:LmbE family N-acetylglucosaminyl deacetylase
MASTRTICEDIASNKNIDLDTNPRRSAEHPIEMKIVVLSPHRDDAAFSLSLAIGSWLRAGHAVDVVSCFTTSDYAPLHRVPIQPEDRTATVSVLRRREDETWQQHFATGLMLIDLNMNDAPLRLNCTPEDVCITPVKLADEALQCIQRALHSLAPDALVIPLGLGAHVDHLTARQAALSSFSITDNCAFYEDLPYAARPGAAEEIESIAHSINPLLKPVFPDEPCDTEVAINRKHQLALCYPSQINKAVAQEIADFCANYAGRERLWVNPAWSASSLTVKGRQQ